MGLFFLYLSIQSKTKKRFGTIIYPLFFARQEGKRQKETAARKALVSGRIKETFLYYHSSPVFYSWRDDPHKRRGEGKILREGEVEQNELRPRFHHVDEQQ